MTGFEKYLIENGYSVFHLEFKKETGAYVPGYRNVSAMVNIDNRYIKDPSLVRNGDISYEDYKKHAIVIGLGVDRIYLLYPFVNVEKELAELDFKRVLSKIIQSTKPEPLSVRFKKNIIRFYRGLNFGKQTLVGYEPAADGTYKFIFKREFLVFTWHRKIKNT